MNSLYINATENEKVKIIQMMQRKNVDENEGRWKALLKAGPSFLNDPVCLVGLYFTIIFVVIIGFQFKEFSLLSNKSMNPTPGPFLHSLWGWGRRWIRIQRWGNISPAPPSPQKNLLFYEPMQCTLNFEYRPDRSNTIAFL